MSAPEGKDKERAMKFAVACEGKCGAHRSKGRATCRGFCTALVGDLEAEFKKVRIEERPASYGQAWKEGWKACRESAVDRVNGMVLPTPPDEEAT